MNAIVHFLINPLFILWVLILTGIFFYYRSKYRALRYVVFTCILWLFIISVSPIPVWMARHLEGRYKPVDLAQLDLKPPIRIIVLGAGHTNDPDLPNINKLYSGALARLSEGIRIHKLLPGSKLICSGYSGKSNISQAEVAALAAIELGVDPSDTILMTSPHNTKAEAKAFSERFANEGTLIVVTDAIHMPRAMKWFHNHSLNPIAAPTNHQVKRDTGHYKFPFGFSSNKIILMEKSLHEYVGMLAR